MKSTLLFMFLLFSGLRAQAELLSIPEECLAKEVSPCLIKSSQRQILKSPSARFALDVGEETIVKILKFESPFHFELLQGQMVVKTGSKKPISFILNDVSFLTSQAFTRFGDERRLQVYDTKSFILSEYESGIASGHETVILRSEFLAKLDMIRFLSLYFADKKSLMSYLKTIESVWRKEFKLQTNDQTIALQRSIASIEQAAAEDKQRSEKEIEELKKVRRQFFYRTFYR